MKTKTRALIIVTVIAGTLAAPTAESPQAPAGPESLRPLDASVGEWRGRRRVQRRLGAGSHGRTERDGVDSPFRCSSAAALQNGRHGILDGLSSEPCSQKSRVTKTVATPTNRDNHDLACRAEQAVPTVRFAPPSEEWEPKRSTHRELPDDDSSQHSGRKLLESVTVVERNGDRLTVETTSQFPADRQRLHGRSTQEKTEQRGRGPRAPE